MRHVGDEVRRVASVLRDVDGLDRAQKAVSDCAFGAAVAGARYSDQARLIENDIGRLAAAIGRWSHCSSATADAVVTGAGRVSEQDAAFARDIRA